MASSKAGKCYRCGVAGHFRRDYPLRKKCQDGERKSPNFLGSITRSGEEVDDLLVCSEESTIYVGTRWSLEESTVCAGIGRSVTRDEVQVQAQ